MYFGHLDGALTTKMWLGKGFVKEGYTASEIRLLLNLNLLLHDQLVVVDDFLFVNPLLHDVLVDEYDQPTDYAAFLREGVITPAFRRDVDRSFVRVEEWLRENGAYGVPRSSPLLRRYAETLDDIINRKRAIEYVTKQRDDATAAIVDGYLSDANLLKQVGAPRLGSDVQRALRSSRGSEALTIQSRSWFYRLADEVEPRSPQRADDLRLLACAAMNTAMATLLELNPAYAAQLERFVSPIYREDTAIATSGLQNYFLDMMSDRVKYNPRQLANLPARTIYSIRQSSAFSDFIAAQSRALRNRDTTVAAFELQEATVRYVASLREILSVEVIGQREVNERRRRMLQLSKPLSVIGGVSSGAVGLALPLEPTIADIVTTASIIWTVLGTVIPDWIQRRVLSAERSGSEVLLRGPSADQKGLLEFGGISHFRRPQRSAM